MEVIFLVASNSIKFPPKPKPLSILLYSLVVMSSPIRIDKVTKEKLDSFKIHHRETYNDVIERLIDIKKRVDYNDRI